MGKGHKLIYEEAPEPPAVFKDVRGTTMGEAVKAFKSPAGQSDVEDHRGFKNASSIDSMKIWGAKDLNWNSKSQKEKENIS